jgi:hypothetical protein
MTEIFYLVSDFDVTLAIGSALGLLLVIAVFAPWVQKRW